MVLPGQRESRRNNDKIRLLQCWGAAWTMILVVEAVKVQRKGAPSTDYKCDFFAWTFLLAYFIGETHFLSFTLRKNGLSDMRCDLNQAHRIMSRKTGELNWWWTIEFILIASSRGWIWRFSFNNSLEFWSFLIKTSPEERSMRRTAGTKKCTRVIKFQ